jgi:hypothetical protein
MSSVEVEELIVDGYHVVVPHTPQTGRRPIPRSRISQAMSPSPRPAVADKNRSQRVSRLSKLQPHSKHSMAARDLPSRAVPECCARCPGTVIREHAHISEPVGKRAGAVPRRHGKPSSRRMTVTRRVRSCGVVEHPSSLLRRKSPCPQTSFHRIHELVPQVTMQRRDGGRHISLPLL